MTHLYNNTNENGERPRDFIKVCNDALRKKPEATSK